MKELHIKLSESVAGEYQAEIAEPPPGAEGFDLPTGPGWPCVLTLPPPLSGDLTLTDFQGYLLDLPLGETHNQLKPIGAYVYNFLFGLPNKRNVLHKYWQKCFNESQEIQADGMRSVLQLDSPTLIGVPWELCNKGGSYLALLTNYMNPHTLVRTAWKADDLHKDPVPLSDFRTQEPLRVLLTICHRPDDEKVKGPDEALGIDAALFKLLPWMVDLHVLIHPTIPEIRKWCQEWEPHVLHFVGHGGASDEGPYLLLYEHDQSEATPIDQDAMINLFGRRVPRLVVLNACRSGQIGAGDRSMTKAKMSMTAAEATQNFSERLIQEGVQAVIAMQADIKGEDAVALMSTFYRKLAEEMPIDRALTFARDLRFVAGGMATQKWDWALSALYLTKGVRAEEVLFLDDIEAESKVFPCVTNIQDVGEYTDGYWLPPSMGVKIHVGREKEQLMLAKTLLAPDVSAIPPITLLHGILDMGKSTMLYWLSERCAWRGRPFIYADFARTSLDYWDVLRLIRDGHLETKVNGVKLNNHLNPDIIFNKFNYVLNCKLIENYASTHHEMPDEVKDEVPERNPTIEMGKQGTVQAEEYVINTITEAFWSGLARAAEPNGLILFLDHVEMMFSDTVSKMQAYLIDRILAQDDHAKKIRLVLAIRDRDPDSLEYPLFNRESWKFLYDVAQADSSKVKELRFEGLPYEQLCWLAKVWARRYFISCSDLNPVKIMFEKRSNGRIPQPQEVDAYVARRINSYEKTSIEPGRLIKELLGDRATRDWLRTLKSGAPR